MYRAGRRVLRQYGIPFARLAFCGLRRQGTRFGDLGFGNSGFRDERQAALIDLNSMDKKHRELQEEINKYSDNDPAVYEAMRNATKVAHDSVNRWTDNIFALQKWCLKKFPEARDKLEELYKEVGITEDFDYVE